MILSEEILFKELINNYGFNITEITSDNLYKKWIAYKTEKNSDIYIIFTNDENEHIHKEKLLDYAKNNNTSFVIYNIIETKKDTNDNFSFQNEHYYKKIFFNSEKGNIVKYEAGSENLINLITSINNQKIEKAKITTPSKITLLLILANIIMFLISAFLSQSIEDIDTGVLVYLGAKVNILIREGEYYRLFTAMFLHGGVMHLLFNMYALYSLGDLVEKTFGKINYLIIYFASGILSSFVSYIFSDFISVGASGAIFGLLGAALVFAIKEKNRIGKEFLLNISFVIVLNIVIGMQTANIDNFAHFGGLISGLLITYVMSFKSKMYKKY